MDVEEEEEEDIQVEPDPNSMDVDEDATPNSMEGVEGLFDLDDWDEEELLDSGTFERRSTGDMLSEVSQAVSADEAHLPETDLPDEDLTQDEPSETVVPLGATSTLAPVEKAKRPVQLRLLLWNVANLGGKFGYPYPRPQTTIDATARIIHAAKPDVVTILEVLERGQPDRAPKPPVAISARPPRGAQNKDWEALLDHFDCLEGEGMADVLMSQVGPAFINRVQAAIWPGAAPHADEPASAFTIPGLTVEWVNQAWDATCKKQLAAAFPKPATEETASADEEDDEAETAQILAEGIANRRPGPEPALADWRSKVMPLLVQEEYTHWYQRAERNYETSGRTKRG